MNTRGRFTVIAAVAAAGLVTGCASMPAAVPTSTAELTASPTATPVPEKSAANTEAQQRADGWLAATPVPPGAMAVDESPSETFAGQWQGWVCTPTMTVTGYWTVDGMLPGEAMNWMIANPTPGLVLTRTDPVAVDQTYDAVSLGATPEGENLEGIAFTYVNIPNGTAIRAEVGAIPTGAICPTPPGGGTWGRPGEG